MPDHFTPFDRYKRKNDHTIAAKTFNEARFIFFAERHAIERSDGRAMLRAFFNNRDHQPSIAA